MNNNLPETDSKNPAINERLTPENRSEILNQVVSHPENIIFLLDPKNREEIVSDDGRDLSIKATAELVGGVVADLDLVDFFSSDRVEEFSRFSQLNLEINSDDEIEELRQESAGIIEGRESSKYGPVGESFLKWAKLFRDWEELPEEERENIRGSYNDFITKRDEVVAELKSRLED